MGTQEELTKNNFGINLNSFTIANKISARDVAKSIGCSEATIKRLIVKKTYPTVEMLKQGSILFAIGYKAYKKLSSKEKKKIAEKIGVTGGGAIGVSAVMSIFSGLSGPSIAYTLGAIGGTMTGGLVVVAIAPIALAATGFGVVKGVKSINKSIKLNREEIDNKWEVLI